ncbi:hypothetical protein BDA96_06G091400 [Sorghum bicolor]|uniref:Uncharacterized protein n=1 Tax=Sorghum bicolor TaxID=4558 RepID=A0A921QPG0_SORBI|nr:hypothetical protein BDA96_06G091400 [Sorghum bicolor]
MEVTNNPVLGPRCEDRDDASSEVELTHNELGMSIITDKHSRVVGEDHQNTRARE